MATIRERAAPRKIWFESDGEAYKFLKRMEKEDPNSIVGVGHGEKGAPFVEIARKSDGQTSASGYCMQ